MANDSQKEELKAKRRLINRLSEQIEALDGISNNDLRRLSDKLSLVFSFLRNMEHYPKGVPFFDPCSVLNRDHIATDILDRYAGKDLRHSIRPESIARIRKHLAKCSVCQARLAYFESQLISGMHVNPVSGIEPHRPTLDVSSIAGGPTTLSPGIGIAAGSYRDDS